MQRERKAPDFALILTVASLLSLGLIMVFSASEVSAYLEEGDSLYYFKKQLKWTAISVVALIVTANYDYWRYKRWSKLILLGSIAFLGLVLIPGVGSGANGAQRWLDLGFIGFQPSELSKLCLVIYMAHRLAGKKNAIQDFVFGLGPCLAILVLICGLIVLEPDLGTAIVIAGTVFVLFFAAGAKISHLFGLGCAGLAAIAVAIIIAPYRMERLLTFLDPWADPLDSGFQIIQSLYALGSGGLLGLGLGQSRQKFLYLPEEHTDFIFAVLGEEFGFIGTTLVIILFLLLIWRGLRIAMTSKDSFGCLLATGLTTMVGLQALVNMGVVTGSMPVTGISLPLISYGGTSLLFTMTAIGMLLNISRYPKPK